MRISRLQSQKLFVNLNLIVLNGLKGLVSPSLSHSSLNIALLGVGSYLIYNQSICWWIDSNINNLRSHKKKVLLVLGCLCKVLFNEWGKGVH